MRVRKKYSQRELEIISDLRVLIENKDFFAVQLVKTKWNFRFVLEEIVMARDLSYTGCPFDEASTVGSPHADKIGNPKYHD